jgi:hypothetical protein
MSDPKDEGSSTPMPPDVAPKQHWEPPRITTGILFESNAETCGKNTAACGEDGLVS